MAQFDIEEAKRYLDKRLEIELRGEKRVHTAVRDAFFGLCALGMPLQLSPFRFSFSNPLIRKKVERVINDLKRHLLLLTYEECRNAVMLSEERNSGNGVMLESSFDVEEYLDTIDLEDKVDEYVNRIEHESLTWIRGALALGLSITDLENAWDEEYKLPYRSEVFQSAKKKWPLLGAMALSFGIGQYVSGENSLVRLVRGAVGLTMGESDYRIWSQSGVFGYYVMRGSTYHCELCDSYVGFHPMSDRDSYPPFHSRCMCLVVKANE